MYTDSTGMIADTFRNVYSHWERRSLTRAQPQQKKLGFTIAVARQAGTQGSLIGREVGKRLGWPVYDHELLELIAKDMGLHARLLENVDERAVSGMRAAVKEMLGGFSAEPVASEYTYVRHLMETLAALGTLGECVIIGRGAAHLLLPSHTLRLRMVGTREHRIATVARQFSLSHADAERRMDDMDEQRRAFIQRHYRKDSEDPANYDLLLNAARFSVNECVDLILDGLHRLEARIPAEAREHPGQGLAARGSLVHGHAR